MIEGSEKRNRQLALELQNSHVCEKRSNKYSVRVMNWGHVRKTIKVLEKRSTACHLISAPQRMATFFSKNIGLGYW